MGVEARWEVLAGTQEYFVVVKRMLNALQGRDEKITEEMYHTYLEDQRAERQGLNLEADMVMVHDHQPAGLVEYRTEWMLAVALPSGSVSASAPRLDVSFDVMC